MLLPQILPVLQKMDMQPVAEVDYIRKMVLLIGFKIMAQVATGEVLQGLSLYIKMVALVMEEQ